MDVDFETLADHADGVAYSDLRIHPEFMREDVQDFAVFWKRDVAGGVHGTADILALDVSRPVSQSDAATAVDAAHVGAGDTNERLFDRHVRDAFSFLNRATDRTYRGVQINDQALAQAFGFGRAERQELYEFAFDFGDKNRGFGAADVQPDQVFVFLRQAAAPAINLFSSRCGRARTSFGIHDHLPRILQINRLHAAGIRLPLQKIVDQHFVFAGELARPEVNRNGLRIVGAGQPGHHHAQIL